jgi:cytochrome c2
MSGKWAGAALVVGIIVGVTAQAAGVRASEPGAASGDPVKGAKIYTDQKCNLCHKVGATGGKLGPDLSLVGTRRDAAWMEKYLQNPKMVDPKNKMPQVKVKGQDLADLIAYLESLGKKK